jgi:hypothetical protein
MRNTIDNLFGDFPFGGFGVLGVFGHVLPISISTLQIKM